MTGEQTVADLTEHARRLLDNRISDRLAGGQYTSYRNADGDMEHDRHVLIWVRQYEATITALIAAVDALTTPTREGRAF